MSKETLLLAGSLVFSLALGEIVLANFFPQKTVNQFFLEKPPMFRADDVLFMDMIPGFSGRLADEEFDTSIEINSQGYRQAEFELDKGDRTRILAIGDSFTFGFGVEEPDGFVRVMERRLKQDGYANVQAINAGVSAWWPDSYYLYLKTRGLALDPDIVIVGFFVGNDIEGHDARHIVWPEVDAEGLPLVTASKGIKIENAHRVRTKPRARWTIPVLRNSHLFQLLYSSGKAAARAFEPSLDVQHIYELQHSPETENVVDKVKRLLLGMAKLSRESGAHFVVVMIPQRLQVHAEYRPDRKLDWDKPQRIFNEFFEREGIACIDLLPIMREAAAGGERVYYHDDAHFNRLGYRIAGEEVARYLNGNGLVNAVGKH